MKEKTIGVLGGMGPEATLAFFGQIIAATPAVRDQEHLRVVIDSNPKVPDRTAAILAGGASPVPAMTAGIRALQAAGADFVVIPCVSAHAFIDELKAAGMPIVSMFEAAVAYIRERHPAIRTVGLLATTGTLRAGRFTAELGAAGIRVLEPEARGGRARRGRAPHRAGRRGGRHGLHRAAARAAARGPGAARFRHPVDPGRGRGRPRRGDAQRGGSGLSVSLRLIPASPPPA